jgi:hypothetical protein
VCFNLSRDAAKNGDVTRVTCVFEKKHHPPSLNLVDPVAEEMRMMREKDFLEVKMNFFLFVITCGGFYFLATEEWNLLLHVNCHLERKQLVFLFLLLSFHCFFLCVFLSHYIIIIFLFFFLAEICTFLHGNFTCLAKGNTPIIIIIITFCVLCNHNRPELVEIHFADCHCRLFAVEYSHHSLPFSEWKAEGPSHE